MKGNIEYFFSKQAGLLCHRLDKNLITYQDDYSWNQGDYDNGLFFFLGYSWDCINQWEVINGQWIIGRREDGTTGSILHPEAPVCDISDAVYFYQTDIENIMQIENFNYFNDKPVGNAEQYVDNVNVHQYEIMYAIAELFVEKVTQYRYLLGSTIEPEISPPPELPKRDYIPF